VHELEPAANIARKVKGQLSKREMAPAANGEPAIGRTAFCREIDEGHLTAFSKLSLDGARAIESAGASGSGVDVLKRIGL